MGFYTDVEVDLTLRSEAPQQVAMILTQMMSGEWEWEKKAELPEHLLFESERWMNMFRCGSTENAVQWVTPKPDGSIHFKSRSSFKNYDREVDRFCDWIHSHCVPQTEPIIETVNEDKFQRRYFSDGRAEYLNDPDPYNDWRPGFGGCGEPPEKRWVPCTLELEKGG